MAMIAAFDVIEVQHTTMATESTGRPAAMKRYAIPDNDPAWLAAMRAPVLRDAIPEQERLDMEELRASSLAFIDGSVVSAEIEARRPR